MLDVTEMHKKDSYFAAATFLADSDSGLVRLRARARDPSPERPARETAIISFASSERCSNNHFASSASLANFGSRLGAMVFTFS